MSYALISVFDKTGVIEVSKVLLDCGVKILSTGGTARHLKDAGIEVTNVSDHTGFQEMMDGRVKTLHPKIHGGLLGLRNNEKHVQDLKNNSIEYIDYVIVNLYPFEKTLQNKSATDFGIIENIDIGGPSMIRSGSKNFESVTVVVDHNDYGRLVEMLKKDGKTSIAFRKEMARKAFQNTSFYDMAISNYFSSQLDDNNLSYVGYKKLSDLRYGENPHQKSELYTENNIFSFANNSKILSGKDMSFNNYVDCYFAYHSVADFYERPAVSIIKHGTPCGLATGDSIDEALKYAWEGDIVSSFGSIIALTREVDTKVVEFLSDKFVEVIIAPSYSKKALDLLSSKKKNLRIIEIEVKRQNGLRFYRHLDGMLLIQDKDDVISDEYKLVSGNGNIGNKKLIHFSFRVVKHVKSNAIVICHEYKKNCFMMIGMGAGQPNRVDALRRLALPKTRENIQRLYSHSNSASDIFDNLVMASDAFFPFSDTVEIAYESGIRHIVQPGGSKNDGEVISFCKDKDINMWLTGVRHFLH